MTKYFVLKVRSVTLHPAVIAWSVFFVLFWAAMWVYVFGSDITRYSAMPWYQEAVAAYVATAFGSLGVVAMGSAAITLTQGVLRGSAATRFLTRFSRLGPGRLLVEDLAASTLSLVIIALIEIVATIALAWQRYKVLVEPRNPLLLAALLVAMGVFFYELALVSGYIALNTASRHTRSILTSLTLITSFIPYTMLFTSHGNLAGYLFPPIGLQALIVGAVSGKTPPATGIINWFQTSFIKGEKYTPIDPRLATATTLLWLITLALLVAELARRTKAVHPAELA